jgi:hypothetical protein
MFKVRLHLECVRVRRTKEEIIMVKIFAVSLFAIIASVGAASAHGGGAWTMPGVGYTDLPPYHPQPLFCHPAHWCAHIRHQSWTHGH